MSRSRSTCLSFFAGLVAPLAFAAPVFAQNSMKAPASSMAPSSMAPGGGMAMTHGTMAHGSMAHDTMTHRPAHPAGMRHDSAAGTAMSPGSAMASGQPRN